MVEQEMAINAARHKRDVDPSIDRHIDRGYAWVILAGCFLSYMCVIGTVKAYGILYTEIVSYYGSGSGSTAWIGSAMLLGTLGLSPVANMLSKKYSFRRVAMGGGMLITFGYFLSGFVDRIELLFVTFGLFAGTGYGMSFSPCSTIISYYFKDHRALANGIVVSASGVGAICFPFVYKYLINEYGLKGAFWVIGAILSHVCVSACLFRQPPLLVEAQKRHLQQQQQLQEEAGPNKSALSCCSNLDFGLKFSLFKKPQFTMYLLAFVFGMNGFGNNLIMIPSQIKALGYDKFHIALGVTIMGAFEVVSRILFGWFADLKIVKSKYIFIGSMFVSATISFIAPYLKTFEMMGLYAGMVGAFPGSIWSQLPVLVIDVVGMEDFPPAFGLVMISLACGCLLSQPTIGWLRDSTGSWDASFILTGCLFLCATLIMALEGLITEKCSDPNAGQDERIERIVREESLPLKEHQAQLNDRSDNNMVSTASDARSKEESESLHLNGNQELNGGQQNVQLSESIESLSDQFTSPRISRTYKPYNSNSSRRHNTPTSPVPVVDTQDV